MSDRCLMTNRRERTKGDLHPGTRMRKRQTPPPACPQERSPGWARVPLREQTSRRRGLQENPEKTFPPVARQAPIVGRPGPQDTPVRDPSQARLLGRKKAMETAALWKPWKTKSTLCLPIRLGWFLHRSHSAWKTPSDGVSHSSHSFCGCSHPNESMLWDGARPPVEKPKAVFPPDASRSRREIKGCP